MQSTNEDLEVETAEEGGDMSFQDKHILAKAEGRFGLLRFSVLVCFVWSALLRSLGFPFFCFSERPSLGWSLFKRF